MGGRKTKRVQRFTEYSQSIQRRKKEEKEKNKTYPSGSRSGGAFCPARSSRSTVFPAAFPAVGIPPASHAA